MTIRIFLSAASAVALVSLAGVAAAHADTNGKMKPSKAAHASAGAPAKPAGEAAKPQDATTYFETQRLNGP